MANKAMDFDDMPDHPEAPKKAVSNHKAHTNSFVSGKKGKGKKKGRRKHSSK